MSPELVLCAALDAQRARLPVSEAELASFLRRHGPALTRQLAEALPRPRWSGVEEAEIPAPSDARPDTAALLPLGDYDRILVGFSGGTVRWRLDLPAAVLQDRLSRDGDLAAQGLIHRQISARLVAHLAHAGRRLDPGLATQRMQVEDTLVIALKLQIDASHQHTPPPPHLTRSRGATKR
ncbi:hypothetical protein L6R49_12775 [Myxococcota bacterium]|nr:hypothetical protein [Myxococcota bacterium]